MGRNVAVSIDPLINGPETNEAHTNGDQEVAKALNSSCGMMEICQDTNNPMNTWLADSGKGVNEFLNSIFIGPVIKKAQNKVINGQNKIQEADGSMMEITQDTTLDKTKHSALRIVESQEPISFGLSFKCDLKGTNSIIQQTGGLGRPPDSKGSVNLKSRLKVKVVGKRSSDGMAESKLVGLISGKENVDANSRVDTDVSSGDVALLASCSED